MTKFNFNTDFEAESCETANPKDSMERLAEEARFELVYKELEQGIKKPGLWLKAKVEAKGDNNMAEAIYAGLRVQSLQDEEDMLRAGSEAKIAKKEKARQAKKAEAARASEAAFLAEQTREYDNKVAAACNAVGEFHSLSYSDNALTFLKNCGYSVEKNFINYSLNGVKLKKIQLISFASEVYNKKKFIPFRIKGDGTLL